MRCCLLLMLLLLVGCGYGDVPEPQVGKGQLIVELKAYAKRGLNKSTGASTYDVQIEAGGQFRKVNYSSFPDIAVWLESDSLKADGGAEQGKELLLSDKGPDKRLIVLPVGATLKMVNKSKRSMCLYCQSGTKGFDTDIKVGDLSTVKVEQVGVHEIYCDEDDEFRVTLVVTPNSYARQGMAGEYVYFDGLTPGSYTLCVKAARLPLFKKNVAVVSGERLVIKSELGVHQLSDSK